jgi:hypothetical protein
LIFDDNFYRANYQKINMSMISKHFCTISLNPPNFDRKKSRTFEEINASSHQRKWTFLDPSEYLWSENVYNEFHKVGILPHAIRHFVWNPGILYNWHTDDDSKQINIYCCTNWIISGGGILEFNENIKLHDHPEGFYWKMKVSSKNDEVQSATCARHILLDVSIPHRINMLYAPEPRETFSVVWKTLDNQYLQFWQLKERFDLMGFINH